MYPDLQPSVERTLARHDQRRRQGLATVSVLVGPPEATAAAWRAHFPRSSDIRPAMSLGAPSLATACVAAACAQCSLLPAAVAELGRRLGRPADRVLGEKTEHDIDQLLRTVDDAHQDLLSVIRIVCTRPVESWPDAIVAELPGWRGVVAIDRLLADPPAVWLEMPPAELSTTAGPIVALATAVPRWALGIGVTAEDFEKYRVMAGDSRDATLLCGGLVGIPMFAMEPAGEPPGSDPDDEPEGDDPARSAAERFLFERLNERWPGLFALNVALPFPFGTRPAEADLYAGAVRLVIEIDGFHHFQDPVCYRRDRRKDWAYQANGYRVVRVLAEDVVPRAGEILDRIALAVDHCRRLGGDGGGSGQQS